MQFSKRIVAATASAVALFVMLILFFTSLMGVPLNFKSESSILESQANHLSENHRSPDFRPKPPPLPPEPDKYAVKFIGIIGYATWTEQPKKEFFHSSSGGTSHIIKGEFEYSATVTVFITNVGENDLHAVELTHNIYVEEAVQTNYGDYTHYITRIVPMEDLAAGETVAIELSDFRLEWSKSEPRHIYGQVRLRCNEGSTFAHLAWNRDATESNTETKIWTK